MAKEGKSAKVGRNKDKPSNVAYIAQDRYNRNKKRRALKEERKQIKRQRKARERALRPKRQIVTGVA